MYEHVRYDLERYAYQPVCLYLDDGHIICGTILNVYCDSVRLMERNDYIVLLPLGHVVAVQEPKMCCQRIHRECCG